MAGVSKVEVEGAGDGFEDAPGVVVVACGEGAGGVDDFADAAEVVGAVGVEAGISVADALLAFGVVAFEDGGAFGHVMHVNNSRWVNKHTEVQAIANHRQRERLITTFFSFNCVGKWYCCIKKS